MELSVKQFLLASILVLYFTTIFAATNTGMNNSSQPVVLLSEMNDQSPNAESYIPKVQPTPQFIQDQNAISAKYNQKQEEIAEQEEYFDEMEFGMFGDPYWGNGGMFGADPYMYGPSVMIPTNINNSNNSNNYNKPKPKMIDYYESQLPNGDILFKQ